MFLVGECQRVGGLGQLWVCQQVGGTGEPREVHWLSLPSTYTKLSRGTQRSEVLTSEHLKGGSTSGLENRHTFIFVEQLLCHPLRLDFKCPPPSALPP